MQVDIKFIARKAGVSPATVSRVLNGTKPVSKALQARVLEEVERYGYRPNSLARGLIQGKSSLIGVIVPNVSDLFHAKVISGIEAGANEHGYNVILSNIYTDMERQKRAFAILRERRVDGIILLHENTPRQMEEILPLVEVPLVLASVNVPGSCLPTVGIDDERAAYDTVSYLIRLGHRRIGGIFVSDSYTLNDLRRRGYLRAMAEHGLPVEERYMVTAACTMEEGEAAAEQLFRETPPPTALSAWRTNWLWGRQTICWTGAIGCRRTFPSPDLTTSIWLRCCGPSSPPSTSPWRKSAVGPPVCSFP